jgi:hypothetical protein
LPSWKIAYNNGNVTFKYGSFPDISISVDSISKMITSIISGGQINPQKIFEDISKMLASQVNSAGDKLPIPNPTDLPDITSGIILGQLPQLLPRILPGMIPGTAPSAQTQSVPSGRINPVDMVGQMAGIAGQTLPFLNGVLGNLPQTSQAPQAPQGQRRPTPGFSGK